ncbi:MAG: hypothetical protein MI724_02145 [Spirochaetales bacterium]|nr:hypothetical protein [Spirochaetales bacterium]
MSTTALILTAALAQNVILVHYLGVGQLPTVLFHPRRAAVVSGVLTLALVWVAAVYWTVYRFVLLPLGLLVLVTPTLAVIIGVSTLFGIRIATYLLPYRRRAIVQVVPVALVNTTVFVVAMALVERVAPLWQVLVAALAAGAGAFLALVPLAAIRAESRNHRIPEPFRGDASVYLGAAFMALAIQQIDRLLHAFFVPLY